MAQRKNIGMAQSKVVVQASAVDRFCVASSYRVRLEWDPFVRAQRLVDADRRSTADRRGCSG